MYVSTNEPRKRVKELIFALDTAIEPGAPEAYDANRHALRLRFALARVEELEHAGRMSDSIYTPGRLEVAASILKTDVERSQHFLRTAIRTPLGTRMAKRTERSIAVPEPKQEESEEEARAA